MEEQTETRPKDKKVILIVDDLALNREILKISFENECEIFEADNGLSAIEILKHHHVDVVVTDIFMKEMDGYELIKYLRADPNYSEIPIVAVTEHDEVIQKKVLEMGANEFVCKPFVDRSLRSCIGGILFGEQIRSKIEQYHQVFDNNPIPFVLLSISSKYSSVSSIMRTPAL